MANHEQFTNNGQTTLNGALDASQTNVVVASAATLPTAGNFRIRVESEIMLVTAVSGTTLTVVRGQEGTTGATHADGTLVRHILTAAVMANTLPWDEIITKASDTGRSGTSATDDPELVSALTWASGDVLEFELDLIFSATSTTPDIKMNVASSQSMQGFARHEGSDTTSNAVLATTSKISGTTSTSQNAGTNNGFTVMRISGLVRFAAGSATFSYQWATLNGGSTVTLKAGSQMRLRRISNT